MLHHGKDIADNFPNASHNKKVENLIGLRKESNTVNRKEQAVIVFRHSDFAEVKLHCVERFCHVMTEGPVSEVFTNGSAPPEIEEDVTPHVDEGMDPVVPVPPTTGNMHEDIQNLCAQGFSVDDDNEPVEENIPPPSSSTTNNTPTMSDMYQEWDSRNACNRKADGHSEENPRSI